jgi:hypothetical protein
MKKSDTDYKLQIIAAGRKAVDHLIKVAEEEIITGGEGDLSADRLKNAAATKKIAIFDAFEIMSRIQAEEEAMAMPEKKDDGSKKGFAERHSK